MIFKNSGMIILRHFLGLNHVPGKGGAVILLGVCFLGVKRINKSLRDGDRLDQCGFHERE